MKDKKKTKTIPRQVRWDKLDNTAHLFPSIAGESMTNVYRISVTLKEEVQVEFLQRALDMILPKFDGFNLRMRTGVFWYYFEENGKKAPKVTEEAMFPCRFIRQNKNRNYLFRYYLKENKDVRRRACTIRYGASCISLANRWKRTPQHVGAWMVFHQESRYNYPVINNCFMVLNELRMEQRNLWNA